MTGVIINNNFYDISTGNTKIEYSSMNEDTIGYSMYGVDIPYTEILKEYPLEYLKTTYEKDSASFDYLHYHSKNTEYKMTLKLGTLRESGILGMRVTVPFATNYNSSKKEVEFYIVCKSSSTTYAYYSYVTGSGKDIEYSNDFCFRTTDTNTLVIPYNTKFTIGYKNDKFYSDLGHYYQVESSPQRNMSKGKATVDMAVKPYCNLRYNTYFYGLEEVYNGTTYYYKPFYNTETQKFYIKETTTNTIVCTLNPSDIDEYQILN